VKLKYRISFLLFYCIILPIASFSQKTEPGISFDFYGDTIELSYNRSSFIDYTDSLSDESVKNFYARLAVSGYEPVIKALVDYKDQYKLDDWLYYQLIRKTAQLISPKADNYQRYTLYKWFLLAKSGYNTSLLIGDNKLLFYVQSDEIIYDIPFHTRNGKQFVCLNYHDYGNSIDFDTKTFTEVAIHVPEAQRSFSYKISQLPNFKPGDYMEKDLLFNIYQNEYHFKVKMNPQIQTIFANYPVVDYESYFNIPLSKETYSSLIPLLKKNIKGMSIKHGVDYLMRFTRYAFLFEPDSENFGKEKRLTAEQTLLYEHSDCEDRAALFFYLVKEIYNLPMIVLSYTKHVTIAVKFDSPIGKPILYKGIEYSICEPTPQKKDLQIGQLLPDMRNAAYEVVYAYTPVNK
jgi:hypothetical protein